VKREKFLWPLTQSHHRALLTARRVRERLSATGPGEKERVREMAREVQKLYDEELRLHFWDEEKILALYEERMGPEEPEPQKIRREHRLLESLMAQAGPKSLLGFAELLTSHVRFEEDVLFGKIEKILSEGDKQAVGRLLEREAALNCAAPP
jgi:hemerythrin-like domain-containing protein